MKDAIVAGIWGNSNYDSQEKGKDGPRRQILESIEEQFQAAVHQIRTGAEPESDEIDWDDPFFAASKAPRIGKPPVTTESEEDKEHARMLDELDQT